ncbi:unnamed protein product [Schistosoma haematobium]|nr:unnamed protein product [Schistosoma haematobium]CAH8627795.1 unnamed protein product [Schistosoma haematobium]
MCLENKHSTRICRGSSNFYYWLLNITEMVLFKSTSIISVNEQFHSVIYFLIINFIIMFLFRKNLYLRLADTWRCLLEILPPNLGGKNKTCITPKNSTTTSS